MKKFILLLCIASILPLFCGCILTRSSHVIVGNKRPPIDPSLVKLYTHPPTKYEEIGIVSADSRDAFASAQSLMDAAITRLKTEAGKLGANGIILTGAGDQYGGSIGYGFGSATANGGTAFGTGTSFSAPVVNKAASGMAIYVIQE